MYNKICLMVPTYKRINWITRFTDSAIACADSIENICFCFCVNKKDEKTREHLRKMDIPKRIVIEDTLQPDLSFYFNTMYEMTEDLGENTVVSMLGDDMIFQTKGYDTTILKEINEKNGIGVFWCNDDYIAREKLCVNLFVTRKFVNATGKPFMCPFYKADMIDAVWMLVGQMTHTSCYLPDVVIKHSHSTAPENMKNFDFTFQRLSPLQKTANAPENQKKGEVWATIAAGNLISAGMGSW